MSEIIKLTLLSVKEKINIFNRSHCFEIFGYDFILDADFNPYLLEINTNPGLEESSSLIKEFVPRMIDDCLRLTLDDLFFTNYTHQTNTGPYHSPYPVMGYPDEKNMWDFICNIKDIDEISIL
jgi:tubulin--tyrosine ligase